MILKMEVVIGFVVCKFGSLFQKHATFSLQAMVTL